MNLLPALIGRASAGAATGKSCSKLPGCLDLFIFFPSRLGSHGPSAQLRTEGGRAAETMRSLKNCTRVLNSTCQIVLALKTS